MRRRGRGGKKERKTVHWGVGESIGQIAKGFFFFFFLSVLENDNNINNN